MNNIQTTSKFLHLQNQINQMNKQSYNKSPQQVTNHTIWLGGGMANNLVDAINGGLEPLQGDYNSISTDLFENLQESDCMTKASVEIGSEFKNLQELLEQDGEESNQYFCHTDHLGSSSWITDASGAVNQHLQYLPPDSYRDGEHFVNQTSTSWSTPYTFSGKEKDSEMGYSYFGARYYDSDLSVWLSVDPMSDRLLFISPYSYCYNHPINYKDPDGKFPWLTGAIGAVVSVGIGAISAAINDEEYSFKEGLKDAAIGFAIGSGEPY